MIAARAVFHRDADLMPPELGDGIGETFQKSGWPLGRSAGTLGPVGRSAAIVTAQPRQLNVFTRVSVSIAGEAHRVVAMGLIWLAGRCMSEMIRRFSHCCKRV
jgi:hypothetical protein